MLMLRIAWFDRKTNIYDYGSNQPLKTLCEKIKWIEKQNKKIPTTRYWIELIKTDISSNIISIENIEASNIIKIVSTQDPSTETDYLLL